LQRSGLLLVGSLQFVDFALQILVSLKHGPKHHITALLNLWFPLFVGTFVALRTSGVEWSAPIDLFFEPHVLLDKFLVVALAFFKIVESLSRAVVSFAVIEDSSLLGGLMESTHQ
jgi:hypothetical protein